MRLVLFLLLIAGPLLEIALLIKVGQVAGVWLTLALMIGMAVLGTLVLNRQRAGVMQKAADALAEGRAPVGAVVDGVGLTLAGILFITPGFISDMLGLLLLIPPLRQALAAFFFRQILKSGDVHVTTYGTSRGWEASEGPERPPRKRRPKRLSDVVIETDFERLDTRPINPRPGGARDGDTRRD